MLWLLLLDCEDSNSRAIVLRTVEAASAIHGGVGEGGYHRFVALESGCQNPPRPGPYPLPSSNKNEQGRINRIALDR